MALIPCPACQRHVYTTETNCPFCHRELGALDESLLKRAPVGRMSRAALVVLGMSSVACGGDSEHSGDDTASNSGPTTGTQNTTGTNSGPNTTGTNGGPNTTGTTAGPSTTGTGNVTDSSTTNTDTTWAAQSAYGSPSIGFTTGEPPSGSGGTTSTDGGSMGGGAGEAGDVGGAGGNTGLPTGGNGQPVYGAPPTPW